MSLNIYCNEFLRCSGAIPDTFDLDTYSISIFNSSLEVDGALLLSAEIVEPKAPQYLDRLQQMFEGAMAWARQRGLPVEQLSSQSSQGQLTNEALGGLKFLWDGLSLFILMVSLLVLLLLEVGQYREKI